MSNAQEFQAPLKFPWSSNAWLESGHLLTIPEGGSQRRTPCQLERTGAVPERLPLPPAGAKNARISAPQGHILCLSDRNVEEPDPKGQPVRRVLHGLYRYDQETRTWETEPLGTLSWPHLLKLIPLSDRVLLAVAMRSNDFMEHGRRYPFAIFKRTPSKTFQLDHVLDAGFSRPALNEQGVWTYPVLSTLWVTAHAYACGDHTVVASPHGLFWVFDAKGRLRRHHTLFPCLDENTLRKGHLWPGAVLRCQPTRDGDLLISALSLDAVTQATQEVREEDPVRFNGPTQASRDHFEKRERQAFARILGNGPVVDWFTLDPQQGTLSPIAPPKGLPGVIHSRQAFDQFNWVFKPDGNLHMFSEEQWKKEIEAIRQR